MTTKWSYWPRMETWVWQVPERDFDYALDEAGKKYRESITGLIEQTRISKADVVGYIDATISFFQDILPFCDDLLNSWDLSRNEIIDRESLFLKEVFSEIDRRTWFDSDQLKFVWAQVNHVVQPFRNIRSSIEGALENVALKDILEWVIRHDIEKIKNNGEEMIGKLENYKELCAEWEKRSVEVSEFEYRFRWILVGKDVKYNIDISNWSALGIDTMVFQIILDNLASNYSKYWKNGELFIFVENNELQIIFLNDVKSDEERWDVLSSEIWNDLLRSMVEELCGGKMEVVRDEKAWKYKIVLSWINLKSQVRS